MGLFYQLFQEKSFPSELYHGTSLQRLFEMLRDDKIVLSYTGLEGADKDINEGKDFFFSMSYDKYGRYLNLGNQNVSGSVWESSSVVLVMDAFKLQSRGKLIDVDYWGGDRGSYTDDEKEVRYISDERVLQDLSKFVKEVHVFLDPTNWFSAKEGDLKRLTKLVNSDLDVYLYNDSKAFRVQLKAKAISIDELKQMVFSVQRKEKRPSKYMNPDRESYTKSDFMAILNLLKGQPQETDAQKKSEKSLLYDLNQYIPEWADSHPTSSSMITQTRNVIHNIRKEKIPEIQEFSRVMRRLGLKNTKDLLDYLHEKYVSKSSE